MEQQERQKIIDHLTQKGIDSPCQRCGNRHFELLGIGYVPLNIRPSVVNVGAKAPVAVLACSYCGYIIQHALGALYSESKKEGDND